MEGGDLAWVPLIRHVHLACVMWSGTLFAVRGLGLLTGAPWPMRRNLRVASVLIDTLLLAAGATLWAMLSIDPRRDHWLAAKLVLLLIYVALGTWTLKRARSRAERAGFLVAALTVFATMLSIGWTRDPLGLWRVP